MGISEKPLCRHASCNLSKARREGRKLTLRKNGIYRLKLENLHSPHEQASLNFPVQLSRVKWNKRNAGRVELGRGFENRKNEVKQSVGEGECLRIGWLDKGDRSTSFPIALGLCPFYLGDLLSSAVSAQAVV
ncbi:hypothetical protein Tco_0944272 [Tanacetum coccineum]